jgi:hypothetical protein
MGTDAEIEWEIQEVYRPFRWIKMLEKDKLENLD